MIWPPPDRVWLGAGSPRTDAIGMAPLVGAGAVVAGGVAGAIVFPLAGLAIIAGAGATSFALGALWMLPAFREGWALTPTAIVHRAAIGAAREHPIARVRTVRRAPPREHRMAISFLTGARRSRRREQVEVAAVDDSYAVVVGLDDGTEIVTCPLEDADTLVGLVSAAILGHLDLELVPRANRSDVPAEYRRDLFFSLATTWDGDEYGPCFIGPTVIARWNGPLPVLELAILASIAGRDAPAESLEPLVVALAEKKSTSHVAVLPRVGCVLRTTDSALTVQSPEREIVVGLSPERLEHARRMLGLESAYRA